MVVSRAALGDEQIVIPITLVKVRPFGIVRLMQRAFFHEHRGFAHQCLTLQVQFLQPDLPEFGFRLEVGGAAVPFNSTASKPFVELMARVTTLTSLTMVLVSTAPSVMFTVQHLPNFKLLFHSNYGWRCHPN